MLRDLGFNAVLTLLSHSFFILIAARLMRALRFDKLVKPNHERDSQLLFAFIAIGLGYLVSSFFLSLLSMTQNLPYLFK